MYVTTLYILVGAYHLLWQEEEVKECNEAIDELNGQVYIQVCICMPVCVCMCVFVCVCMYACVCPCE